MADPSRRAAEKQGRWAEGTARWYLRLMGYRILVQNFTCPRGEIDLIARKWQTVAFVEVKCRPTVDAGLAAVSAQQRRRIEAAAEVFLAHRPALATLATRFDIIVIPRRPTPGPVKPVHVRDAWRPA